MNATRLSPTTWSVEGETLDCSRSTDGCTYTTKSRKRMVGQPCPKCGHGRLNRCRYQVDVAEYDAVGRCGCFDFENDTAKNPTLSRLPVHILRRLPQVEREKRRCKHIKFVRLLYRGGNLDALVNAVPREQEGQP